jgi:hypothetical protein
MIRRLDAFRYRRRIDRALALHLRGEVRGDGLTFKKMSTHLEIEWMARDIHPWDLDEPADRKALLFVQQTLTDTEAAITRLFETLPQTDVVSVKVLEKATEGVIMAGTIYRSAMEPDTSLSVGMRLWQRGIKYHSDGLWFELRGSSEGPGVLPPQRAPSQIALHSYAMGNVNVKI